MLPEISLIEAVSVKLSQQTTAKKTQANCHFQPSTGFAAEWNCARRGILSPEERVGAMIAFSRTGRTSRPAVWCGVVWSQLAVKNGEDGTVTQIGDG